MLEVLVGFCLGVVGFLVGYSFYLQRVMRDTNAELQTSLEGANKNLLEFSKAYADFQSKCAGTEQRLASLEFRINQGGMGIKK